MAKLFIAHDLSDILTTRERSDLATYLGSKGLVVCTRTVDIDMAWKDKMDTSMRVTANVYPVTESIKAIENYKGGKEFFKKAASKLRRIQNGREKTKSNVS